MKEIPLLELQERFLRFLQLPDGEDPNEMLYVRSTKRIPIHERLEIYHYAYWARLEESLAEDYPELAARIGEKEFAQLVREYIRQFPSRYASILEASQHFTAFLKKARPKKPYLAELARREWAETLSFTAPEVPPLAPTALSSIPGDQWPRLKLSLHPSVILLESEWEVDRLKKEVRAEQKKRTRLVLHRYEDWVWIRRLTTRRWAILNALATGKTLGELIPLFEKLRLDPARVTRWFSDWVGKSIIARVEVV